MAGQPHAAAPTHDRHGGHHPGTGRRRTGRPENLGAQPPWATRENHETHKPRRGHNLCGTRIETSFDNHGIVAGTHRPGMDRPQQQQTHLRHPRRCGNHRTCGRDPGRWNPHRHRHRTTKPRRVGMARNRPLAPGRHLPRGRWRRSITGRICRRRQPHSASTRARPLHRAPHPGEPRPGGHRARAGRILRNRRRRARHSLGVHLGKPRHHPHRPPGDAGAVGHVGQWRTSARNHQSGTHRVPSQPGCVPARPLPITGQIRPTTRPIHRNRTGALPLHRDARQRNHGRGSAPCSMDRHPRTTRTTRSPVRCRRLPGCGQTPGARSKETTSGISG